MILTELEIKSKHKVSLVIETEDDYLPLDVISINDKKLEFYIYGIKKELTENQKQEILNYIEKNINQDELEYIIANDDYNNIFSKLTIKEIFLGWHNNKELILDIIDNTIKTFIFHEEYEKCIILNNIKNKIKKYV